MQMLQIYMYNEFAWLVHVGILDGVNKKSNIQFKVFVELQ